MIMSEHHHDFMTSTESNIVAAAFTRRGVELALSLGFRVFAPERFACENVEAITDPLTQWAGRYFHEASALVFVGASGIAVRAIAPHVASKLHDPAVIVIDETGRYVVPLLSGHVGGANELARKIAGVLGAQPVITTATDVNNLPAVDEWSVKHNCVIENPENVKHVSSALLEGLTVGVAVTCENIAAPFPVTLYLRPRNLVLGAGCNKGVSYEVFEEYAKSFLDGAGVSVLSLMCLASIDLKADEPAMKNFARAHNIPFMTFTAEELQALPGKFTASDKVLRFTGTDNVCERSAVMAAGEGAVLLRSKCVYDDVTFALARSVENDIASQRN